MGLTSLQVCMDSSDHWLQGTIHEENGMDSSSPSTGDILTCSRPLIERKLRPPHDQALKCPRCDSTHTKFCYYNNYSLTQPRYFCKSCRRYWTKGGTLRNIPVGGGCRKNKKVSSKKSSNDHHQSIVNQNHVGSSSSSANNIPTDLHLSFPDMQFSHLANLVEMNNNHGCGYGNHPGNFMDAKYNFMLENHHAPIDFMETKYESLVGNGDHLGLMGGVHDMNGINFPGLCSPFPGIFQDNVNNGNLVDNFQRHHLMGPYESQDQDQDQDHQTAAALDVKPNTAKLLSLDWHDQQAGKGESFGYHGGLGISSSWTGLMNGYGSSATNPLV